MIIGLGDTPRTPPTLADIATRLAIAYELANVALEPHAPDPHIMQAFDILFGVISDVHELAGGFGSVEVRRVLGEQG